MEQAGDHRDFLPPYGSAPLYLASSVVFAFQWLALLTGRSNGWFEEMDLQHSPERHYSGKHRFFSRDRAGWHDLHRHGSGCEHRDEPGGETRCDYAGWNGEVVAVHDQRLD